MPRKLDGFGHGELRCVPLLNGEIDWTYGGKSARDLMDLPGSVNAKRASFYVIRAEYKRRGIIITMTGWSEAPDESEETNN